MKSGKKEQFRCGYVAVLGKANAGKSSLVNTLVGEEVAIVSHRRQTTREQILGIKTGRDFQILFVDTPGIHHSKNALDRVMNKSVRSAIGQADVVVYLFDGTKPLDEEELKYLQTLKTKCESLIVVETKIDKIKDEKLRTIEQTNFQKLEKQIFDEHTIFEKISVVTGENLAKLEKQIVEMLPENSQIFDAELYTDRSVKFLIAEKIRGLLLESLDEEIPHGIAVVVTSFEEDGGRANIEADIICERDQHKGIIIGRGGANLKNVGQKAREYAESLLDERCNLKLFVKVDKDWREKNVGNYY